MNVKKGDINFKKDIEPSAKHLIEICLNIKAESRPTIDQILDHPYFTKQELSSFPIQPDSETA